MAIRIRTTLLLLGTLLAAASIPITGCEDEACHTDDCDPCHDGECGEGGAPGSGEGGAPSSGEGGGGSGP